MTGERIVLSTIGSLGDLYPFIALAHALEARGAEPVLAVAESHLRFVEGTGIEAAPIYPDIETYIREAGYQDFESWTERAAGDPDFLLREGALRFLEHSALALDGIARGADAMIGSSLALAAPMIAERRDIPYFSAVLSPMLFFLKDDPPALPGLPPLSHRPVGRAGRLWNGTVRALLGLEMRRRFGAEIGAVRKKIGLRGRAPVPLFSFGKEAPPALGLFSPRLVGKDARLPSDINVAGFCWREAKEPMPDGLADFIEAGEPPLVFSLGSFAVFAERGFYEKSVEAARMLGRRAVLLTGMEREAADIPGDDVFAVDYAPHEQVFPKAAAVVHHGGVGTTARALAAGVPQLVVPHLGDQWDNAARLRRLGVAASLDADDYTPGLAATELRLLLEEPRYRKTAKDEAVFVGKEDGAANAAEDILLTLCKRTPGKEGC